MLFFVVYQPDDRELTAKQRFNKKKSRLASLTCTKGQSRKALEFERVLNDLPSMEDHSSVYGAEASRPSM
jgi:hypothetical protein